MSGGSQTNSTIPTEVGESLGLESNASVGATVHDPSGRAAARPERPATPAAGDVLGRYVVLGTVGSGAMGTVVTAYDESLDRAIALKLLHSGTAERHARRLTREAQALAKLSHPNVVHVYEIGQAEGRWFIAMELVRGQTLRQWQQGEPGWRECVKVYLQVGQGLAAAHAVGLVHRDFKPDNCIIDEQGRPRVLDFGLVRETDVPSNVDSGDEPPEPIDPSESSLTRTGAILGTVAYMPLEQLDGKPADARSDQFSFCVALYEAIYGQRPFRYDSVGRLTASLVTGEVKPPPKGSDVPGWLRRVLLRGLSVEPEDRWPDMNTLLAALADDPSVRRRKRLRAVGVAAAITAGVWGLQRGLQSAEPCADMDAELSGIWDGTVRDRVEASIEGTGLSYAADTGTRVRTRLDDYAAAWVQARGEACLATARGTQSARRLDLRMTCLDRKLREFRATVDVLAAADEAVVARAVTVTASLPRLEPCADAEALEAGRAGPEDPAVASQVEAQEEQLARARALQHAGRYAEGLHIASAVVTEAETLGYPPLLTQALAIQGALHREAGDYAAAEPALERAYTLALEGVMVDYAARASVELMDLYGRLAQPDKGHQWARHAEPLATAVGTEEARASIWAALGTLANVDGDYPQARDYFARALELRERTSGTDDPVVAMTLRNLGLSARRSGDPSAAHEAYERALDIQRRVLGPEHPDVATTLSSLGVLASSQGDHEGAREYFGRALAIAERALGAEHPSVAGTLNNLAMTVQAQGQHEVAIAYYERALAIFSHAVGPEHPNVAAVLSGLGRAAAARGDYAGASDYHQRALMVCEQSLGAEHPRVADILGDLGDVAASQGESVAAREYFTRALALWERTLGAEHPNVARALTGLGRVALEQGEYEQAHEVYERALAIWERQLGAEHEYVAHALTRLGHALVEQEPAAAVVHLERALRVQEAAGVEDPVERARARFVLARALWSAPLHRGRDRARALDLAEQARATYALAGSQAESEVDAWLRRVGSAADNARP